ncbi:MAG: hypothetical protein GX621_06645, partial [Pirellulaceae bacterium]|nr:hypothetical protein [Pirellulaceae bacterium]
MNRPPSSPIVVRLTPPGRGAVATLLVAGLGAVEMVEPLFHARGGRTLRQCPSDVIVVGRFGDERQEGTKHQDEEIVARRAADD